MSIIFENLLTQLLKLCLTHAIRIELISYTINSIMLWENLILFDNPLDSYCKYAWTITTNLCFHHHQSSI